MDQQSTPMTVRGLAGRGGLTATIRGWTHTAYDAPMTAAKWTQLGAELDRGDVVSFWVGPAIQHSHTCIGGTNMWGANNEAAKGETWIWDECTSENWWDIAGTNNPPWDDCDKLIIYNRP